MKKTVVSLLFLMVLTIVSFAVAQESAPTTGADATSNLVSNETPGEDASDSPAPAGVNWAVLLIPIGCGLVIFGGGFAIGRVGTAAVESMARQPEVAGKIQTAMILAAALVEGVTLFALVICLMGYLG